MLLVVTSCVAVILGDNTYYVSSSTVNCPQVCHPLSYYIADTATYFTPNTTFIFMEGEHLLENKGLVQVVINDIDNITLRGEKGHSNTTSNIIIKCGSTTRGLVFNSASAITIYGIIITGCGQKKISPIKIIVRSHLINQYSITIADSTFTNNTVDDTESGAILVIAIYSGTDAHISVTNSVFINNACMTCNTGAGLLIVSDTLNNIHVTISNSAFTNNTVGKNGGPLLIDPFPGNNPRYSNITISSSTFTENIVGCIGGGLAIYSKAGVQNNVTITNIIITSTIVGCRGGGLAMVIESDNDACGNNIIITDSIVSSNTVYGDGGGAIMILGPSSSIHNNIIILNSTFSNNKLKVDNSSTVGNGLVILFHTIDAYNNVTIAYSTFTDNVVDIGGGLYIFSETNINNNIFITNSIFTNNTVDTGGGLHIYTGKAIYNIITITYCKFTENTINYYGGGLLVSSTTSIYNSLTIAS